MRDILAILEFWVSLGSSSLDLYELYFHSIDMVVVESLAFL